MVLDESLDTVADGHHVVLFNQVRSLPLEKCLSRTGLVGKDCIHHRDLLSVPGLDEAGLSGDNLSVDVVSTSGGLYILHFDKLGLH